MNQNITAHLKKLYLAHFELLAADDALAYSESELDMDDIAQADDDLSDALSEFRVALLQLGVAVEDYAKDAPNYPYNLPNLEPILLCAWWFWNDRNGTFDDNAIATLLTDGNEIKTFGLEGGDINEDIEDFREMTLEYINNSMIPAGE